jgi:hypothetical protein
MNPLLRIVCALVLGTFLDTRGGRAQTVPEPVYFYVTAEPAVLQNAYSPIYRAHMTGFNQDRVKAQYYSFLQRVFGRDWYPYAHHAFVHGPFATEAAARADYNRRWNTDYGVPSRPPELIRFQYFDASIVLAVISAPRVAGTGPAPWEAALDGLPIAVHRPGEYSWTTVNSDASMMAVDELYGSAVVIWVDRAASLSPGSNSARSLHAEAANALSCGLDVLVAMPDRSLASATAAISPLKSQFAARGKRLEVVVANNAAMKQTLSRALREFLSLPGAISLIINSPMQ